MTGGCCCGLRENKELLFVVFVLVLFVVVGMTYRVE